MDAKNIPGLAYGNAKQGKILEQGDYGKANLELNVPVSAQSVFAISSMSKQLRPRQSFLLQEEAKLGLDDWLKDYIPEARQD